LVLYMVELALIFEYLRQFRHEYYLQFMVFVMLLFDTIGTVSCCASAWIHLIIHAHQPATQILWTLPVLIITTALNAMMEQSFLIYRFFMLSRAKVITSCLVLLMWTHVAFAIWSAIYLFLHPQFGVNNGSITRTIAYCVKAAVDILIPCSLIWQLRKTRSPLRSTTNLIRRLSAHALTSGSLTAIIGIVFIALFWSRRPGFSVISYIFGRIYTITFLANLIARKALGNVHYVTDTISPGLEILPMFGTSNTASTDKTSTAVTDNTEYTLRSRLNDIKQDSSLHAGDNTPPVS